MIGEQIYVVVSDAFGGLPEVEVQAEDFEDAATDAMESWNDGGTFAGINLDGDIMLLVMNKDSGTSANVKVTVEYEPVYTAKILELHDG